MDTYFQRTARKTLSLSPTRIAAIYLGAIAFSEFLTTYINLGIGLIAYSIVLLVLFLHIALAHEHRIHDFLMVLLLPPLIRLFSLTLPLAQIPTAYWYVFISIPLFVAAFLIARNLHLSVSKLGLRITNMRLQMITVLGGFVFGYIGFFILKPEPLIKTLTWGLLLGPAFTLLICSGFLEELLFRGMLQQVGESVLGRGSIYFTTVLFMVLYLGYQSVLYLLFVLTVSFFWGHIVAKTHSIIGVTLSHGVTNILVWLIFPFLLSANGTPFAISTNPRASLIPLVMFVLYFLLIVFAFVDSIRRTRAVKNETPAKNVVNVVT